MEIQILPCACPCTTLPNPCDCCPCITNARIYASINFSLSGAGNSFSPAGGEEEAANPVNYTFNYTNNLRSSIAVVRSGSSSIPCSSCYPDSYAGNSGGTGNFLTSDFDLRKTWDYGSGAGCFNGTDCKGYTNLEPPPPYKGCPTNVCIAGQFFHISPSIDYRCGNEQQSYCSYDVNGSPRESNVNYCCTLDLPATIPAQDKALVASFAICPSTSLFELTLSYTDDHLGFSVGTDSSNGSSTIGSTMSVIL